MNGAMLVSEEGRQGEVASQRLPTNDSVVDSSRASSNNLEEQRGWQ